MRVFPLWEIRMNAEQLFRKAERLARAAEKNGGPLPVDLLRQAAELNYAPAIYALASWHLHGKGVAKDVKKAVGLLKKAADQEFPPAEYDLAVSFELGNGVSKSPAKAFSYYLRGAIHGDLDAQTEVARCFFHGIGVKPNRAEALKWYSTAAERGDEESAKILRQLNTVPRRNNSNGMAARRTKSKAGATQ
jgi:TPR repeat protein